MKTVDVSAKFDNLRTARAVGRIKLSPETVELIREKRIPKGDVIAAAQIAGIMGAKKTPELMPFCHPIPLDHVEVNLKLGEDFVEAEAEVRGIWRTGYEVEAMNAVMMALLTVYDMCKAFDSSMVIEGVRVVHKSGGKSDWAEDLSGLKAAVVTVSDSAYRKEREDKSGPRAVELLKEFGAEVIGYTVVPDEKEAIKKALESFKEQGANIIVTTGGTGFSPRDVTPEATQELLYKEMVGFSEAMHLLGVRFTPKALMSRAKVGLLSPRCMVVNLPGSTKGVEQNLKMFAPLFKHALKMAAGGGH
ncbi:molybdenum cofactor biosynthesis protein C [Thermovibrio ammonificans HB-1]|jgi:molybdenum cofactor biosynthesis protein MoaC|uniref:Molybdopterin adenylyltransferase n=1 Tax=Thermovibrio ammonificans (strain DSM 15698 / JCM 12110 / HB-1) TaxID=648996 RepID=E8T6Q9_THEA1|nr:bifunctional molybdenum cofactor biosynthesis protein MoaC/MoaB [Thermovibrio ammonificans]ADU96843.1 molybdenum cofactor biosynthesis protein C [Thermovibrio ammonificans HB-1]